MQHPWTRHVRAVSRLIELNHVRSDRPPWAIDVVRMGNDDVPVREEAHVRTPFCTLRRFVKVGVPAGPKVLVVAPLAGHFATLLRDTIATLVVDHDVYVTDWKNVRDVPLDEGELDMDGAIEHLMRFLRAIGPGCHVVAVCQPCPSALVATAVLAEDGDDATPVSLTLMAGPVDARISPTRVNEVAVSRPIEWFERKVITTVPYRFAGRGRRVYPGFLQLTGFMSMNPYLHAKRHLDAYVSLVEGDETNLEVIEAFYAEYFAMLDLPGAFYLDTVEHVFQRCDLATGEREWRGRPVDLGAIADTALLTVEGGRDDVCGPGQTAAAQGLCGKVPDDRRFHHLEPDVGHYGVFSGNRWRSSIYPAVKQFIAAHDPAR
jgi:polyhydroxyalkanoate depolymerase